MLLYPQWLVALALGLPLSRAMDPAFSEEELDFLRKTLPPSRTHSPPPARPEPKSISITGRTGQYGPLPIITAPGPALSPFHYHLPSPPTQMSVTTPNGRTIGSYPLTYASNNAVVQGPSPHVPKGFHHNAEPGTVAQPPTLRAEGIPPKMELRQRPSRSKLSPGISDHTSDNPDWHPDSSPKRPRPNPRQGPHAGPAVEAELHSSSSRERSGKLSTNPRTVYDRLLKQRNRGEHVPDHEWQAAREARREDHREVTWKRGGTVDFARADGGRVGLKHHYPRVVTGGSAQHGPMKLEEERREPSGGTSGDQSRSRSTGPQGSPSKSRT